MLDKIAGAADREYDCGYETAVLRGRGHGLLGGSGGAPLSACCTALDGAKSALDDVDLVTYVISPYNVIRAYTSYG
jgi:hypothetical protein